MTTEYTNESKRQYEMTCPVCGEDFIAKRRDHIYCDRNCRQIAYYERHHTYKDQHEERSDLEKLQAQHRKLQNEYGFINDELRNANLCWQGETEIANRLWDDKNKYEKRIRQLEIELESERKKNKKSESG